MPWYGYGVLFFIVLRMVCSVGLTQAATINAASCSITDIQAAHTSASNGDTIQLPTCTQTTWTSTVTITKAVTIKGNGTANTNLQRSAVASDYESNVMFRVQGVTSGTTIFQDFTLNGTQDTNEGAWLDMGIWLDNGGEFRIHHMQFTYLGIAIQVHGNPTVQKGVIDHNTFTNIYTQACNCSPSFGADSYGYAVSVVGSGTYGALVLGTDQNVFIEDNTFTHPKSAVSSNNGARYVFRYNTVTDASDHGPSVDAHGHVASWPVGSRSWEIYNNTLNVPAGWWTGIEPTGGDGVIFNNAIDGDYQREIVLGDGDCSGSYPLAYQIRAAYIWNNTFTGGGDITSITNECPSFVQLNRDYFLSAMPGYTPYTYPHPLVSGGSGVPAATTVLRIIQ